MGSFSGLGIGLSFLFGFILVGLVAELYYLLCWKRRILLANGGGHGREIEDFSFLFCWKRPKSFNGSISSQELTNAVRSQDLEMGSSKDSGFKIHGDDGMESDLNLNLCGPPRFLFTIKEENKEDLESDDAKSRGERSSRKGSRTRSLSDLVFAVDGTPFFTPLSSPISGRMSQSIDSYSSHGFNPLFETSSTEAEAAAARLRSSPPPTFKFLKDAEEKFVKKLLMEKAEKAAAENLESMNWLPRVRNG